MSDDLAEGESKTGEIRTLAEWRRTKDERALEKVRLEDALSGTAIVQQWAASHKSETIRKHAAAFTKHKIRGYDLGILTHLDLMNIGVELWGERQEILEHIVALNSSRFIYRPPVGGVDGLIHSMSFNWSLPWADATFAEAKEAVKGQAENVGLLSALLLTVAIDWKVESETACFCNGDDCFCGTGHDYAFIPLRIFYMSAGMGSAFFLFSTTFSLLQVAVLETIRSEEQGLRLIREQGRMIALPLILFLAGFFCFFTNVMLMLLYNDTWGIMVSSNEWDIAINVCLFLTAFPCFSLGLYRFVQMTLKANPPIECPSAELHQLLRDLENNSKSGTVKPLETENDNLS